jgi:hypothetical protein
LAGEFAGVVEGEFELDGGESAKAALSASSVVGPSPDEELRQDRREDLGVRAVALAVEGTAPDVREQ